MNSAVLSLWRKLLYAYDKKTDKKNTAGAILATKLLYSRSILYYITTTASSGINLIEVEAKHSIGKQTTE